ncbi:response regulator transcription factor [Pseudomonas ovata]|uniref:response regulator transcription factor n=1 Tax=Pseudomonas ovata TaxID=1839709 RepID=UPI000D69DE74|nr:helix-turn-helix transcriptional regulator [Pseudomonas ovata]
MHMTITSGEWTGRLGLSLARRELECTLAVARGMTTKEIAQTLGISPETVTKRLSNAMFKLGVARRAALIGAAMQRQIISHLCVMLVALIAMHSTNDDMRRERKGPERRAAAFETKLARKGASKARPCIAITA